MHRRISVLAAAAVVAGALAIAAAAAAYPGFRTPSKNIACAAFSTPKPYLRCDILSGLRPKPRRRCHLDWTGFTVLLHGRAFLTCAGDTVNGVNTHVLAYGKTWHALGFTCVSRAVGLRCRNRDRHGFFLSRQRSYRF